MSVIRHPRAAVLALALTAALGTLVTIPQPVLAQAEQASSSEIRIPFEQFTLPNGLRVIVHTDRKAPVVAVNLWYHVGSKNEQPGRTGFAHLFEHLMFQGSENHEGEYFAPFELVGVTDQNGTTNQDRTNYFQNVPTTALDMALWMESERMGHLLGAIDQTALDEQRGVVQNEKRQGENQPYGRRITARMFEALYPAGHPYSWQVIGSMADLDAATLDDVKTWFQSWYGPNNAVLVLAGDIDLATARQKVTRYFGDIPASATLADMPTNIPQRSADTRETIPDRVPQYRVYRAWPVAELGSDDATLLDLFAQVLGGSAASRFDMRLVHGERIADNAAAYSWSSEISGTFFLMATVKDGVEAATVEEAMDQELQRLLAEGPTEAELERAKVTTRATFVRGIERVGGFGGKSDVLADCAVYFGDPACYRTLLADTEAATPASVQAAARKWLGTGSHTLVVEPSETPASSLPETVFAAPATDPAPLPPVDPKYTTVASDVDRSAGVPRTDSFPGLSFPKVQRATLSNGMQVLLAERRETPVVQMNMEFPGGYTVDAGGKLGLANFAMQMLDDGAGEYSALQLAARQEDLGASIGVSAGLDFASVGLSALADKLPESLDLYADVLRRPSFDPSEIERVRATWIAGIGQEKARPQTAAMRIMPPLLYGQGHPYAIPFTGTGTEASIASITRQDLVGYHASWLQPEKARIVVVGDTTLEQIVPMLEARFGDWKAPASAPRVPEVESVGLPAGNRVYLIDQPGAIQSNLYIGQLVPSTRDEGTIDFDFANGVLGGQFSARLNMNLREDKHWAYGSYSSATNTLGQRPWFASAAVQSDKTAESLLELRREITEFASGQAPATAAEIAKVRASNTLELPGAYETARSVMQQIAANQRYGRPDDYIVKYKARNEAMTAQAVQAAAARLQPQALTYVVVGDLSKVGAAVRALGLGEVQQLDLDGNPVEAAR